MNRWKRLTALLRDSKAYTGDDSLDAVTAFVTDNNLDLLDNDGKTPLDLKALHDECSKRTPLTLPDDEPAVKAKAPSGKSPAAADAKAYDADRAPQRFTIGNAAAKSYNAKAARGETVYADADQAEAYGAMIRYHGLKNVDYSQKARDAEICEAYGLKVSSTTVGTAGGFTVPQDFNQTLIDIRTNYGTLSPFLRREQQSQDLQLHPRQTGDLAVYPVTQGASTTASDMAFDQVGVTCRKMGCLSVHNNELLNDSALNFADIATRNIAWSFEKELERIIVRADGTNTNAVGTYYGFTGLFGNSTNQGGAYRRAVEAAGGTWTTDANKSNLSSIVVGAGNTWASLTPANLDDMIAQTVNSNTFNAFFCSRTFYSQVFKRLAQSNFNGATPAGGRGTINEMTSRQAMQWNGYDIYVVELAHRAGAANQVCCLFGDISRAMIVGQVGTMTIATTDQGTYWDNDQFAIRGLVRQGFTVHSVGNYTATAEDRNPAPLTALVTAN